MEIYEERIQDLLAGMAAAAAACSGAPTVNGTSGGSGGLPETPRSASGRHGRRGGGGGGGDTPGRQESLPGSGGGVGPLPAAQLAIREAPSGEIMLDGCTEVSVESKEQVAALMELGNAVRAVGAHK